MNFEIKKHDGFSIVVSNVEKLDSLVAPELKTNLVTLNQSDKNIIINLEKTKYCDSSGLSALLVGNRISNSSEGMFVICGLQPSVQKMIEISQLNTVLNITQNETDAVECVLNV